MLILKTEGFSEWARDEGVRDADLVGVVKEMEQGLLGDALGSSIYKKRIRLTGRGKRGGARTILAHRTNKLAVFLFGYSKRERSNISAPEQAALRKLAKELFGYSKHGLNRAVDGGALIKVDGNDQETTEKANEK